jgi:hypothetical protein
MLPAKRSGRYRPGCAREIEGNPREVLRELSKPAAVLAAQPEIHSEKFLVRSTKRWDRHHSGHEGEVKGTPLEVSGRLGKRR